MHGQGGDDEIIVGDEDATIFGHDGHDTIVAGNGNNTIEGNTNGSNNNGGEAKRSTRNYNKKDFIRLV